MRAIETSGLNHLWSIKRVTIASSVNYIRMRWTTERNVQPCDASAIDPIAPSCVRATIRMLKKLLAGPVNCARAIPVLLVGVGVLRCLKLFFIPPHHMCDV